MIFELINEFFDYKRSWFFSGPDNVTQQQFDELCHNLIEEAGEVTLKKAKTNQFMQKIS